MADRPFRLQVLDALTSVLESITPANGYRHDLTGSVFRGRIAFGDTDPLPMVSIIEPPLPTDQILSPLGSEASSGQWELLLQGFVQDDPKHPTDPAHYLVADVRRALVIERKKARGPQPPGIFGMHGLVEDMIIGEPKVRPSDEISAKAYFWLTLTLRVVEDLEHPYGV